MNRFLAVNQDQRSIFVVDQNRNGLPVKTIELDIARLIIKPPALGRFDLVYASGLYDYLHLRVARRLTSSLYSLVNRGGTLLIANVIPGIPDAAYMEAFMDWHLIYRSLDELLNLVSDLDSSLDPRVFLGPRKNFAFLQLRKD